MAQDLKDNGVTIPVQKDDEALLGEVYPYIVFPDVLYNSKEAIVILRLQGKSMASRFNQLYAISETDLPVQRRGPEGGRREYLGRHLLNYLEG